jgi:hypothetical protein
MWREGFRSARPHLRSCRGLPPRSAQDGQELSGTPSPRRWGSLQVKPPPLCPRNGGKPTRHLLFFVSIRKLQYETALLMHLLRHHNMEVLSYKRFTPHCLKSLVLRTWGTGRSFGCLRRVGGTPRRNSECQAGCAPGGYLPHGVVEWRLRRRAGEVGTRGFYQAPRATHGSRRRTSTCYRPAGGSCPHSAPAECWLAFFWAPAQQLAGVRY